MGTAIAVCDSKITINPTRLHSFSQSLQAQDLRSAAVLLVAAIVRNGETTINGSEHLERGYTHLMANLSRLGVRVQYL
ncbi:UDP-N-acetylglucosamine 1-carboxyvinyltransferase 2 [compost metagenome]